MPHRYLSEKMASMSTFVRNKMHKREKIEGGERQISSTSLFEPAELSVGNNNITPPFDFLLERANQNRGPPPPEFYEKIAERNWGDRRRATVDPKSGQTTWAPELRTIDSVSGETPTSLEFSAHDPSFRFKDQKQNSTHQIPAHSQMGLSGAENPASYDQYLPAHLQKSMKGDSYPPTSSGRPEEENESSVQDMSRVSYLAPMLHEGQKQRSKAVHAKEDSPESTVESNNHKAANNSTMERYGQLHKYLLDGFEAELQQPSPTRAWPSVSNRWMNQKHNFEFSEDNSPTSKRDSVIFKSPRQSKLQLNSDDTNIVESGCEYTISGHNLDEFKRIDYSILRDEPFEKDRTGDSIELPLEIFQSPLGEKLNHVATLSKAEQMAFLAGLSIEDWEEAGEWFVDRFAELNRQLQTSRRERRELARRFEAEIDQHYNRIMGLQKELGDALGKMKQTGGILMERSAPMSRSRREPK